MGGAYSSWPRWTSLNAFSEIGGARFFTGLTMLIHMFWAELFVGSP